MRPMKSLCGAAALMMPLAAQADVFDHFNSALAALPASVFETETPAQFVNFHALSMIFQTTDFTPDMAGRAMLGLDLPVVQVLAATDPDAFAAQTGVLPSELNFVTGYGARPDQAVIWGGERNLPGDIEARLPILGFAPVAGQHDTFVNGPLGEMNLGAMDPGNPWVGPMGEASLVRVTPFAVYQASSTAALNAATLTPSAYDTAAGLALSQLFAIGGGYVAQVLLFSPAFGQTVGAGHVPAYLGGALADLQTEQGPVTLLALAYADCDLAQQALSAPWPAAFGDGLQSVIAQTEPACLAVSRIGQPDGAMARNTAFEAAYGAILMRDFAPIAVQAN